LRSSDDKHQPGAHLANRNNGHHLALPTMRSSRCAFSAAAALHRVFVAPIERPLLSQFRPQPFLTVPKLSGPIYRTYSSASSSKTLPRDEQILALHHPYVHVADDDGKISPPTLVSEILAGLDRQTQSLITVALPAPRLRSRWERAPLPTEPPLTGAEEVAAERAAPTIPVCKIILKAAARAAEKARTKKKGNPALTLKTLELNWAIDPHDLGHRLKRMREFLEKGYRVDVLLAGKRKKRKATPEEAEETLRKVRECVEEVEGAREWKSMEGKVGVQVMLYIEGKAKDKEGEQ